MEISDKNYLTVNESRALLGISRSKLYQLKVNELKDKTYSLGKKTYFKRSDLENLFKPK